MPYLELRENHELEVTGPCKWLRHMMDLSFFLISGGILLLTANYLVGLIPVPNILGYFIRVGREGEMMEEQFSGEHRGNMSRTGRLFPRRRGT